jgi:hypothetical protein
MSDFNSSLPVRTEAAGDVDVFLSDATTPSQKLKVNADGSIDANVVIPAGQKVVITDGTDDLAVNADGSINVKQDKLDASTDSVEVHLLDEAGAAFSSSNPLPVEFFENQTEAFDYHEGNAIAANASTTHTFAAPAGFKLKDVSVSGSGKLKAVLSINSNVVAVGFNSTATPMVQWKFQKGLNASSVNVEVVISNLDKQAQNLYSTIVGIS